MKKISIFDTTISDYNLGNQIIMDSIHTNLRELFPNDFFFKLPYMEITRHTLRYLSWSDLVFFGGTNSLSSQMEKYSQWGLNLFNIWGIRDVVLMGIGWWQYQNKKTTTYTKFLLNKALSKNYIHSVRDDYTKRKLNEIGFNKIINTGCPTIWNLTPDFCKKINRKKSKKVVLTFTDYNQIVKDDLKILNALKENYHEIYYWIQGMNDYKYMKDHFNNQVKIIPPNLYAFDSFLKHNEVDYIGTRLHAGIRALQNYKKTIIVGIDNRAIEMRKSFGLPVIRRGNTGELNKMINESVPLKLNIPFGNISIWKNQFNHQRY